MIAPVTHSKLGRKIMEVGSDHSHNGTEICVQQGTVGHKTFRNTKLAPMLWTPPSTASSPQFTHRYLREEDL